MLYMSFHYSGVLMNLNNQWLPIVLVMENSDRVR